MISGDHEKAEWWKHGVLKSFVFYVLFVAKKQQREGVDFSHREHRDHKVGRMEYRNVGEV